MSRYACDSINKIAPYVPGEQPGDRSYIKLNTNENPYYASPRAIKNITEDALKNLKRYSDPECSALISSIAKYYAIDNDNILVTNGSDEALAFCFRAYGEAGLCYADVTYGFYDVIANLFGLNVRHIALRDDFSIDPSDYYGSERTVVIANPNAQTGIALSVSDIEDVLLKNRDNVVIIDQAYVDFFGQNAISLVGRHDNLIVVNTFSKSRSLAGARVGFVVANKDLIADIKKVKNSFHPYNVNTLSMLLAKGAIEDDEYFKESVAKIVRTRASLVSGLKKLGFRVLPSSANFVLASTPLMSGEELYKVLKMRGILVRHFNDARIADFIRITVGTDEETKALLCVLNQILEEK